jgi:hypothetical protein
MGPKNLAIEFFLPIEMHGITNLYMAKQKHLKINQEDKVSRFPISERHKKKEKIVNKENSLNE